MTSFRENYDDYDIEVQRLTKVQAKDKLNTNSRQIEFITITSILLVMILTFLPKSATDSIAFGFSDQFRMPKVTISNLQIDESRVVIVEGKSSNMESTSYQFRIEPVNPFKSLYYYDIYNNGIALILCTKNPIPIETYVPLLTAKPLSNR